MGLLEALRVAYRWLVDHADAEEASLTFTIKGGALAIRIDEHMRDVALESPVGTPQEREEIERALGLGRETLARVPLIARG